MNLTAKHFFFVMIGVTVLSFGGIIAAFYWGNGQLQSKANHLSELKTDNDVAEAKILALTRAKQSVERADEATSLLNTLLPSDKQQEKLIADIIYTATQEAGIPIKNLGALSFTASSEPSTLSGTEQSKDVPGVYSYPFTMMITDISYETFLKLLREIENNGRLVQIDTLQISPDKKTSGQLSSVSLSLKAFLKP